MYLFKKINIAAILAKTKGRYSLFLIKKYAIAFDHYK